MLDPIAILAGLVEYAKRNGTISFVVLNGDQAFVLGPITRIDCEHILATDHWRQILERDA